MASTINASNGAVSGLITSADSSGVLQLQVNNGTPAVTLNTTGSLGVGSTPSYGTSGQVLTSGGSAAAPSWTSITGMTYPGAGIPVSTGSAWGTSFNNSGTPITAAYGGTGQSSYAIGDLLYASSSSALSKLADVATGNSLISGGVGVAPSWGKIGLTTHISGTLAVGNGGTGATTLTGILKGNGTSAFTAATAGTDYVAPGTATTFTAKQTFSGSSSTFATSLLDANETVNVVAAAPSATTNFYVQSGAVQYYTSNAANNWTLNIAFSSGTSMNTALATGQSVTFTLITTQGSTAYYANAITIDGVSVTPKWIGGAPTAGNASGLDVYRFAVVKTASATYTVLASLTQYK